MQDTLSVPRLNCWLTHRNFSIDDEVLFDAWEKYGSKMRSPISKEELLARTFQLFDLLTFSSIG